MIAGRFGIDDRGRAADKWLADTVRWAWRTRILVHLGIDLRTRLRAAAEDEAVRVFAANLRDLLLAAPAGTRATMGLDPGLRTGVKVAIVDATGKVVATDTIYPHAPARRWDESLVKLAPAGQVHNVDLIAIGNGTASRETDKLAAELLSKAPDLKLTKVMVSEAGASVYSASAYASQELPELDVSLRGAVSIARRLQDPLAELVKIDPKSIGVGQYQHDISEVKLSRSLDAVVEDCVNGVGVDLNTASVPLLTRVSGIGSSLAANIVAHRDANGPFRSRTALKSVPKLGPKAFEQCAGFLRIRGGDDPLDASAVHPEAYPVVRRIVDVDRRRAERAGRQHEGARSRCRPRSSSTTRSGCRRSPTSSSSWTSRAATRGRRSRPPRSTTPCTRSRTSRSAWCWRAWSPTWPRSARSSTSACTATGSRTCRSCRATFVKDPREVVKSGDIVRAKVLEVDIPRKRISLTLRLDEETSPPRGGDRDRGDRGGDRGGNRGGDRRGGQQRGGQRGGQQRGRAAAGVRRCRCHGRRAAAGGVPAEVS